MANVENINNWEKIQKGVKETERLIGQKQYNMAMVKARQTLENMVRCMGERACIVEGDLAETIDQLYQGRWISKTTCEHYHKIRMIGNRAVHEGNDNAYEANQAYHLLSQEVYTFANDYSSGKTRRNASSAQNRSSDRGRKRTRKKNELNYSALMRLLIPVLLVVVIIIIIMVMKPGKEKPEATTAAPTTETVTETAVPTTAETEPVTQAVSYKTNDTLNVRKEPSTSGAKLGMLGPEESVDFVKVYDDFWAVINYNGQEGYVARQYLTAE